MVDEALVRARTAGRTSANELADLYIGQSAELKRAYGDYGLEAAIAFLETLRDNLIAIRPPVKAVEPPREKATKPRNGPAPARDWNEDDFPDRFVLVEFNAPVVSETEKAVLIGNTWVPRSQIYEPPEAGEHVGSWPVTEWFADKQGLAY